MAQFKVIRFRRSPGTAPEQVQARRQLPEHAAAQPVVLRRVEVLEGKDRPGRRGCSRSNRSRADGVTARSRAQKQPKRCARHRAGRGRAHQCTPSAARRRVASSSETTPTRDGRQRGRDPAGVEAPGCGARAAGTGEVLVGDVQLVGQGVVRRRQVPVGGARVEHEPRAVARDVLELSRPQRTLDGRDVLHDEIVVGAHQGDRGPLAHLIGLRAGVGRASCERAQRQRATATRTTASPSVCRQTCPHSNCSRW